MPVGDWKKRRLVTAALGLVSMLPGAARGEETYLQYDFSKPTEVFAATLSQSVVGTGVDPAALFGLLQAGQLVLIREDSTDPRIPWVTTSGVLVDAPPEVVWGVMNDFPSYAEFMPQTNSASSKPINDQIEQAFINLAVRVLLTSVDLKYSIYLYNQPPYRSDWVLASGDFLVNVGAYEIVPVPDDPGRSMLFYTSYSQPSAAVVRNLYESVQSLDTMVNLSTGTLVVYAMRDRAEAMHRKANPEVAAPRRHSEVVADVITSQANAVRTLSQKGLLLLIEEGQPRFYDGVAVVPRSREETFTLLRDVEGFTAKTELINMKVAASEGDTAQVDTEVVFHLMVDFTSRWTSDFTFDSPRQVSYVARPGGDIEGVQGTWELIESGPNETIVINRSASDLATQGLMIRQILKVEPGFELGIQASQTMLMTRHALKYLSEGAKAPVTKGPT